MNQKSFTPVLILIGILVIAMVAGGVYFYLSQIRQPTSAVPIQHTKNLIQSPTTTPTSMPTLMVDTSNWKTFNNQIISFNTFPIL